MKFKFLEKFLSKLIENSIFRGDHKVSLANKERNKIRAAVCQLENRIKNCERGYVVARDLTKVSGRIGVLNRFHKIEGKQLKSPIKILRGILDKCPIHNTTLPSKIIIYDDSSEPPIGNNVRMLS